MMDPMERRSEAMKGMPEPSVDEVFEKGPREYAHHKQGDILDHGAILSHRCLNALSVCRGEFAPGSFWTAVFWSCAARFRLSGNSVHDSALLL
jgi:hypothetical protein